jgi:hypothetical protein
VSDAFKIRKKAARWSDLNGALWTSNNFFNEPGMNAYRPLLFINTDGHHEVGLDTTVVYSLIEPNITVWYVGIHKENAPPQWVPLADPGGLQYAIHNFIHQ